MAGDTTNATVQAVQKGSKILYNYLQTEKQCHTDGPGSFAHETHLKIKGDITKSVFRTINKNNKSPII